MQNVTEELRTALADRYVIESELGEGGMATVYLAHDVKHDRKVALKVLRPELAAVIGADRFLAEIKTTANLQHPHILPLHDSGEVDGFLYYVMPYVEGESLRDRLNREKQLPVDAAVGIVGEVADALDYAHRHEVIHRDIKPENILLHDGRAIVADFGIALAVTSAGSSRMTETGMSLGTPHYMSPEQAMGQRELTAASDVYALGAVLYELLVGEPPFSGPTAQAIVARVVTETPRPLIPQRHTVPPHVEAATITALEKLPADRFASAAEFARALSDSSFATSSSVTMAPATVAGDRWKGLAVAATGAAVVLAAMAAWGWGRSSTTATTPVTRFTLSVPEGMGLSMTWRPPLAISPDGRTIAYFADQTLFVHHLDRFDPEPIFRGSGFFPFFAPDGQWVAFWLRSGLYKVPVTGGPATAIFGGGSFYSGASWRGDRIAFSSVDGIMAVPADGGPVEQLTFPVDSANETQHQWPQLLSGNRLLFTIIGSSLGWDDARIVLKDLDSGERMTLVEGGSFGRYLSSGHLLYAQGNGAVFAVPVDLEGGQTRGAALPVLEGVQVGEDVGSAMFAVSETGTLVFAPALAEGPRALRWANAVGDTLSLVGSPAALDQIALSPDGRRIAVTIRQPNNDDVWILDAETGDAERFTFAPEEEETAVWSPDGTSIAYSAYGVGRERRIFVKPVDSGGSAELVFTLQYHGHLTSWSPDGRWLALMVPHPDTKNDIWLLELGDTTSVRLFATSEVNENQARFSPDGRWLAYVSDENEGREDVFVATWPELSNKRQVSRDGGTNPRWSKDGTTLFYWTIEEATARLQRVPITTAGRFTVGTPEVLLGADLEATNNYQVSPDGARFLLLGENPAAVVREIRVVQNWFMDVEEILGGE